MDLYCEHSPYSLLPFTGGFPLVERNDWDFIYRPLFVEGIKDTLFHMGSLKAPGPRWASCFFFSKQWKVLRGSICDLIFKIVQYPEEIWAIN